MQMPDVGFDRGMTGDHDDSRRPSVAQSIEHFKPIAVRQHEVDEEQVERFFGQQVPSRRKMIRGNDGMLRGAQHTRKSRGKIVLIIDE
jgi:hypothetical protein